MILEAEAGETMFNLAVRGCEKVNSTLKGELEIEHNGTRVFVYRNSNPQDVYEKLHYKQIIARMERR